jgi:hypothetical protein
MMNVSISAYRLLGEPRLEVALRAGESALFLTDTTDIHERANDVTVFCKGVDLETLQKACDAFNEVFNGAV